MCDVRALARLTRDNSWATQALRQKTSGRPGFVYGRRGISPLAPGVDSEPVSATTESTPTETPDQGSEAPTGPENGSQRGPGGTSPEPDTGNAAPTEELPGDGDDDRHLSREQANYRRRMKAAGVRVIVKDKRAVKPKRLTPEQT